MVRTEILEFLKNNKGLYTSKQISKQLNHNYRSVQRALSKMLYTKEIETIIEMRKCNNRSEYSYSIRAYKLYKYKR